MLDSIYRNSIQLFSYRLLKVPKIIKTKFERTKKAQRVYPFNTNVIRTILLSDFYIIKGYDKNIASAVVRFTTTRKARVRVRVRVGIG